MPDKEKQNIFGLSLEALTDIVKQTGGPSYAGRQIAEWLYKHHVSSFAQMTNLSKKLRDRLSASCEIVCHPPARVQTSSDGTKKYLFPGRGNGFVESAYIPDGKRHTLCVSSQHGCRMGCRFCMTATMGLHGQLEAGEILNQVRSIPERELLTNIVYMGMGEPLDNLEPVLQSLDILTAEWGYAMSPRRITVSTIGIKGAINRFLEESRCNLAISLHSPFAEERQKLVPMAKAHDISEILDTIRAFPIEKQRRISFEYIVFKDLNHSPAHVKAISRLLHNIRCRINLIRFHPIPGSDLASPSLNHLEVFRDALAAKGLTTTIRKSRGEDIDAACGLLSNKH